MRSKKVLAGVEPNTRAPEESRTLRRFLGWAPVTQDLSPESSSVEWHSSRAQSMDCACVRSNVASHRLTVCMVNEPARQRSHRIAARAGQVWARA